MMNYRLTGAVVAVLVMALSVGALALQVGETAPEFTLLDQFGKKWELSGLKNTVTVLVAADKHSGRMMGPWVDNLKEKYGDRIQVLGLLDLHTVPGIGRGIAKSRIRKETKDPLMLDFNGATAKAYDVSSKYPVAVVIDKSSTVREVRKTEYTTSAFNAVTDAVNAALKK